MQIQTVNLKKLACGIYGTAKPDSSYRRLQRFFSSFKLNYDDIATLIFHLFHFNDGKHYLIVGRTNWQWGKRNINILFLCIAYKKMAIPIFWLILIAVFNITKRV